MKLNPATVVVCLLVFLTYIVCLLVCIFISMLSWCLKFEQSTYIIERKMLLNIVFIFVTFSRNIKLCYPLLLFICSFYLYTYCLPVCLYFILFISMINCSLKFKQFTCFMFRKMLLNVIFMWVIFPTDIKLVQPPLLFVCLFVFIYIVCLFILIVSMLSWSLRLN